MATIISNKHMVARTPTMADRVERSEPELSGSKFSSSEPSKVTDSL